MKDNFNRHRQEIYNIYDGAIKNGELNGSGIETPNQVIDKLDANLNRKNPEAQWNQYAFKDKKEVKKKKKK